MSRVFVLRLALLAVVAFPALLPAQVPPGHFIVGAGQTLPPAFQWTGLQTGIEIGHPRTPGAMQLVTGLPANLTSPLPNTPPNGYYGIGAIAVHEPSGDILVGDIPNGTTPNQVHLYRFHVDTQTLATTLVATYVLGTTMGSNGDVNQIAQLDADHVVVTCNNVTGAVGAGPMAIAEVDLSPASSNPITPWPVAAGQVAFAIQAICIDPATGDAYVAGTNTMIQRIPAAPAAGRTTAFPIAPVPITLIENLQWDAVSGTVLAGGRQSSSPSGAIFRVDPTTAIFTTVLPGWQNAPSIVIEPASGDILFGGVQIPGSTPVGIWHLPRGSTTPTFLSNTVPTGPGALPMGIAVAPAPGYYGAATTLAPTMPPVPWSHGMLPGGLPLIGNRAFALQLDVPPAASVSWSVGISLGSSTPNMPQIPGTSLSLLIDVNGGFLAGVSMASPIASPIVPLAIPNNAALTGVTLFLQAVTFANFPVTGTAIGATDGARVTIL